MNNSNKTKVALLQCNSYNTDKLYEKIKQGIYLIGGIEKFIKKGEKILLKPNLLAPDPPETATTTHPSVFESTAKILIERGVLVYYGDSPSFHDPLKALKKSGIYDVACKLNLKQADFQNSKKVFYKEGRQNKVFEIAKGVLESDGMVSLPKLKTHGLTILTGAIKNQFGCIPGVTKTTFHAKLDDVKKFSQMLVDLTMFLKPRLYIMDGILAMEGNGPRRGNPVHLGVLLLSSDPVALDTVASVIIGINPYKIIPTVKGEENGLGTIEEIEVVGSRIEDVQKRFKLPTYSGNFNSIPPFLRRFVKNVFIQRPVIHKKKCVECYECYKICPTKPKSISIGNDNYPAYIYHTCIRCYCCQENCPEGAITIKTKLF